MEDEFDREKAKREADEVAKELADALPVKDYFPFSDY